MAIKNYRTRIDAKKTLAEIQDILLKHRVQNISTDVVEGKISAIKFTLTFYQNTLSFRLPCNPEGVLATMRRDGVQQSYCTPERAYDIAWRIIKDWLDAQFAIIDAGQARVVEVFLPYLLEADGETLYQKFEFRQKQLKG